MKSKLFHFFTDEKIVAIVISLNAIVLFLLSFDHIHDDPAWANPLSWLDNVFVVYFLLEAILKIRDLGWKKYIKDNWNRFDFAIVILSLPSLILMFDSTSQDFSTIFVFRIIRIARFFKFIRFIPNIEELLAGIQRAFRASIFVLIAFTIFTFVVSLISCRLFKEAAPQYFDDPIISFYSIFKIFTIEGWYEIPDTIAAARPEYGFFIISYFIIILVIGGLFGLSIVNAIFVEEMVRDNEDDLREQVTLVDKKLNLLLKKMELSLEAETPNPESEVQNQESTNAHIEE